MRYDAGLGGSLSLLASMSNPAMALPPPVAKLAVVILDEGFRQLVAIGNEVRDGLVLQWAGRERWDIARHPSTVLSALRLQVEAKPQATTTTL